MGGVISLRFNPYLLSFLFHLGLLFLLVALQLGGPSRIETVDFEVIGLAELAPSGLPPLNVMAKPTKPKAEIVTPRSVFGVSPTANNDGEVATKAGNTVAVAPDEKQLLPSDVAALPIPTDEYLVTAMPVLLQEVRIPYPQEARQKGIEGAVVMDLLVDNAGVVRESRLIEGPGYGLSDAALQAVKQLKFKPARIQDKNVAVRVRYIYRFVLER